MPSFAKNWSGPPTIAYKGDFDLVTQADRRSEAVIVSRLQKYSPSTPSPPKKAPAKTQESEYRWHVDPLDGTTNFAHGYPCFCVSMALARKNELLLGVIYNPVYNELFFAARGEGAIFQRQENPLLENRCTEEQPVLHRLSQS